MTAKKKPMGKMTAKPASKSMAKPSGLTASQKKLPPFIQKAILKKKTK
jgi:hypothetical protein